MTPSSEAQIIYPIPPDATIRGTVVVPTCRKAGVLALVEALRRQTATDFELILVDEVPDRPIGPIIPDREPETFYPSPRVVRVPPVDHFAIGRMLNAGIQHARGRVVFFLNDWSFPPDNWVARHLGHHEAARCVVGGPVAYHALRDPEAMVARTSYADLDGTHAREDWRDRIPAVSPACFMTGNVSMRLDDLLLVNGFDERFDAAGTHGSIDTECMWRLRRLGIPFSWDPGLRVHRVAPPTTKPCGKEGYTPEYEQEVYRGISESIWKEGRTWAPNDPPIASRRRLGPIGKMWGVEIG